MIPSVLQGLIKTNINNAVQSQNAAAQKAVPPPPAQKAPRDPKVNQALYDAIFSPNSMMMQGIRQVTPPGTAIPQPPVTQLPSAKDVPGIPSNYDPLSDLSYNQQSVNPQLLIDTGDQAANVASAAGIPTVAPIVPPVKPTDPSVETQVGEGTNKAVSYLENLGKERKKIIEGENLPAGKLFGVEMSKFKTESINSVNKRINDIIKETDPTALQQQLMIEFNKARPIQKVTTARDYFIETDAKGNEKLTKRGEATLVIALLANLFGAPGQGAQTSAIATNIADRFSKEQNVINEAKFKQEVDTFNQKIQGLQAEIGFKTQRREALLAPEKIKLDQFKTQLDQNTELTKAEKNNLSDLLQKQLSAQQNMSMTEFNRTSEAAKALYTSTDFNERMAGYTLYTSIGVPVPMPSKSTVKQEKAEADTAYTRAKESKLYTDQELNQVKTEIARSGLKYSDRMFEAKLALMKAQKERALRPPSQRSSTYLSPMERMDLSRVMDNVKQSEKEMRDAKEEADFEASQYDKYSKDTRYTPEQRKVYQENAKARNNAAAKRFNDAKNDRDEYRNIANTYGAFGGAAKGAKTPAPTSSGAPRIIK